MGTDTSSSVRQSRTVATRFTNRAIRPPSVTEHRDATRGARLRSRNAACEAALRGNGALASLVRGERTVARAAVLPRAKLSAPLPRGAAERPLPRAARPPAGRRPAAYNQSFMAAIFPFAALRPAPHAAAAVAAVPYDVVSTDEARALARRQSAELPARLARRDRFAAGHRSACGRGLRARGRELPRPAVARAAGRGGRAGVLRVPPAHGRAHADRHRRVLLDRRIRTRRDQEAREDAAGQGRRSDAAHARDRRADRAGVSDLRRVARRRRRSSIARPPARRSSISSAPDGVRHAIWTIDRVAITRRSSTAFARDSARSTSPTAIIAPPARRARAARCAGRGAGEHDRVLAVAFPDNQMQILPYNRVVQRPERS